MQLQRRLRPDARQEVLCRSVATLALVVPGTSVSPPVGSRMRGLIFKSLPERGFSWVDDFALHCHVQPLMIWDFLLPPRAPTVPVHCVHLGTVSSVQILMSVRIILTSVTGGSAPTSPGSTGASALTGSWRPWT